MGKKCLWGCVGFAAFMLAACGEDSAGTNSIEKNDEASDKDGTVQVEDFDDLPNCTEKREGMEATTESGNKYICEDGEWKEPDSDVLTYETEDDLPNCTEKREGVTARIEETGETYTCNDGEWVEEGSTPPSKDDPGEEDDGESGHDSSSSNKVATEDDLPNCTKAREGEKVWVEELEEYLVCKSKSWVAADDDEESESSSSGKSKSSSSGTADSSDSVGSSSSNGSGDSSSASGSSSSTSGSSSASSSAKIAGTCAATGFNTLTGLGKNEAATWSFTPSTSGIGAENFHWTFDEGASTASSTVPIPSVSYSIPGTHTTKLVVNKGLDSESKEITCSVKVTGTRVKNCACATATTSPIRVTPDEPRTVSWSVSGCTGAGPFTYSWSSGYTGTGATANKSIGTEGNYAPTVKITNSEEMDTTITCPSVTATEPPSATCNLGKSQWDSYASTTYSTIPGGTFYFIPKNVAHVSGTVSMTVTMNGVSKTMSVSSGNSGLESTSMTAPSLEGTYPVTLSYNGEQLCSATLTVEYPKITSTSCTINSNNKFSPGASFSNWDYDVVGPTLSMDFYQNNVKLTSLSVSKYYNGDLYTVTIPTDPGVYNFRLVYRDNEVCRVTKTVALPTTCSIGAVGSASGTSYTAVPGQQFAFKPGNSSITGSLDMDLTLDDSTQSITVKPSNNTETTLVAPAASGTYPVTLSYNGQTACSATLTVALPTPTCNIGAVGSASGTSYMVNSGESFDFKPGNSNFVGTIDMDLTFDDNVQSITLKPSNNTATTLTAPSTAGVYPVTLSYGNSQVCSATLTVVDFEEVTAAGTYSGSKKIKFVNSKTCQISASASTWNTWVMEGTISTNWGTGGQISGTLYVDIPSGQWFEIRSCW